MKKNVSKITMAISMIIIVIVTILLSVYLSKSSFYQKINKSKEDFVGTFSWGATEKSMENMIYLAIISDEENENSVHFVEYYVSNEKVIKQGKCSFSDNNYITLLDEDGNTYAHIVYVTDKYLLFDGGKEGKIIEKIGIGPVLPTNTK